MKKKQCVVIGLGRFGMSVAESLSKLGNEVVAIDIREENVRHISSYVSHAMQADIKDDSVIKQIGVQDFDVAVVGIGGDMEASCLAILALKQNGVKYIIAKAKDDTCGKILSAVGADKVILPEYEMGLRVSHSIYSPNIIDFFEFSEDYSIVEISTPSWAAGKTIEELDIRKNFHINIIAIKSNGVINADVNRDTIILENDILIVIGRDKEIIKFK